MMAARRTSERLIERLPPVRGRLTENVPLAPITWFRAGGAAEVMFRPPMSTTSRASSRGSPPMCR
jgi:UDP-N-acetylmuramate dehydrogenase